MFGARKVAKRSGRLTITNSCKADAAQAVLRYLVPLGTGRQKDDEAAHVGILVLDRDVVDLLDQLGEGGAGKAVAGRDRSRRRDQRLLQVKPGIEVEGAE